MTVDFSRRVDAPLFKKFAMYNAGTINPRSNYDRDLDKILPLNADHLRIDLGVGKNGATGGTPTDVVTGPLANLQYNFTELDQLARLLNERNVLPFWSWCYIPKPLQQNTQWWNLDTAIPNWRDKWQEIHREYAAHYKTAGIKIGYHEIYNEPDLEQLREWGVFPPGFTGFLDFADWRNAYNDMYKYGVLGLRQGDPDAVVGGPALALGDLGGPFIDFVSRENLPLDFYSFHSYLDGTTWPTELNSVRALLARNSRYATTDVLVNEFSWLNDQAGNLNSANSPANFAPAAAKTLDAIARVLPYTDVTLYSWAQFMESTFGDDSYGLIRKDGRKKAMYNALKLYADMPVERYAVSNPSPSLRALASADDHKAAVVVWNIGTTTQTVTVRFNNLKLGPAKLDVYRIDQAHASVFDGAPEDLAASESRTGVAAGTYQWSGTLPLGGVVYFTLNDAATNNFEPAQYTYSFGKYIRTWHYYPDRAKDSYADFDRKTWKAYLGAGTATDAYALTGIEATDLPASFYVRYQATGPLTATSANSLAGVRIDFRTPAGYTKSVLFHGGIYNAGRTALFPYGTKRPADAVQQVDLLNFNVRPADYAPAGWDGRVILSAVLQHTGAGSRADVTVRTTPFNTSAAAGSQSTLQLFPNPATESVTVALSSSLAADAYLDLYTATGALARHLSLQTGRDTLDLKGLAKGIYLVKVFNGDQVLVQKLVKE
ncbi:MAG: T9SS type A sorting domain-containing protein [Hymenobacter sp.]|nr:T9SS type A sorting domain-containing protein [Hymenobacter sp.]